MSEKKYEAILIDTSTFEKHGLRIEKGLLNKLSQFKKSPIQLLFPDVINSELASHLEEKIKVSRAALEKALNDAQDHLFFEGSDLTDAKQTLIEGKEIGGLAQSRISKFMKATGALPIETGKFVNVSDLLAKYFANEAPFAKTGKKKNEFPDAIVLMAVDAWAEVSNASVLAIATDGDWKQYCENSKRIDYEEDLSTGLAFFNEANAPYQLIDNLEQALDSGKGQEFLSSVNSELESIFSGFTPDQEADSYLHWEPDGCYGWLHDFSLSNHEFRVIDQDEDWAVLEALANISIQAEGDFSFSVYDSIDKDYTFIGNVTATAIESFESEILITLSGELSGPIENLMVEEVEVVRPIKSIDFGDIEPEYSEYD